MYSLIYGRAAWLAWEMAYSISVDITLEIGNREAFKWILPYLKHSLNETTIALFYNIAAMCR